MKGSRKLISLNHWLLRITTVIARVSLTLTFSKQNKNKNFYHSQHTHTLHKLEKPEKHHHEITPSISTFGTSRHILLQHLCYTSATHIWNLRSTVPKHWAFLHSCSTRIGCPTLQCLFCLYCLVANVYSTSYICQL